MLLFGQLEGEKLIVDESNHCRRDVDRQGKTVLCVLCDTRGGETLRCVDCLDRAHILCLSLFALQLEVPWIGNRRPHVNDKFRLFESHPEARPVYDHLRAAAAKESAVFVCPPCTAKRHFIECVYCGSSKYEVIKCRVPRCTRGIHAVCAAAVTGGLFGGLTQPYGVTDDVNQLWDFPQASLANALRRRKAPEDEILAEIENATARCNLILNQLDDPKQFTCSECQTREAVRALAECSDFEARLPSLRFYTDCEPWKDETICLASRSYYERCQKRSAAWARDWLEKFPYRLDSRRSPTVWNPKTFRPLPPPLVRSERDRRHIHSVLADAKLNGAVAPAASGRDGSAANRDSVSRGAKEAPVRPAISWYRLKSEAPDEDIVCVTSPPSHNCPASYDRAALEAEDWFISLTGEPAVHAVRQILATDPTFESAELDKLLAQCESLKHKPLLRPDRDTLVRKTKKDASAERLLEPGTVWFDGVHVQALALRNSESVFSDFNVSDGDDDENAFFDNIRQLSINSSAKIHPFDPRLDINSRLDVKLLDSTKAKDDVKVDNFKILSTKLPHLKIEPPPKPAKTSHDAAWRLRSKVQFEDTRKRRRIEYDAEPSDEELIPGIVLEVMSDEPDGLDAAFAWLEGNVSLGKLTAFVFASLAREFDQILVGDYPEPLRKLFREAWDPQSMLGKKPAARLAVSAEDPVRPFWLRESAAARGVTRYQRLASLKVQVKLRFYDKPLRLPPLFHALLLLYERLEEIFGRQIFRDLFISPATRHEFLFENDLDCPLRSWRALQRLHTHTHRLFNDTASVFNELKAGFNVMKETAKEAQIILTDSNRLFNDDLVNHPLVNSKIADTRECTKVYGDQITFRLFKVFSRFGFLPPFKFESSPLLGLYLRAREHIKPYTILGEYVGVVEPLLWNISRTLQVSDSVYELDTGAGSQKTLTIVPEPYTNFTRYIAGINNSRPSDLEKRNVDTLAFKADEQLRLMVTAGKSIDKGAILYLDYNAGTEALYPTEDFV